MFFASDNSSGAAPAIMAAVAGANDGYQRSYGADALMQRATAQIREVLDALRKEDGYSFIFDIGTQASVIVAADPAISTRTVSGRSGSTSVMPPTLARPPSRLAEHPATQEVAHLGVGEPMTEQVGRAVSSRCPCWRARRPTRCGCSRAPTSARVSTLSVGVGRRSSAALRVGG